MNRSLKPTLANELCSVRAGAIVVISSAGGIEALTALLAGLPNSFPLPIIVAQHLSRRTQSWLPQILEWSAGFPARWATPGAIPAAGAVYVVPPGQSARIDSRGFETAALPDTATSWFASVDELLESVADRYGPTAVAIVLSGMLPAAIRGLRAIKAKGGIVIAQSLSSCAHAEMPMAARDQGKAEIVFSPARIAEALLAFAES